MCVCVCVCVRVGACVPIYVTDYVCMCIWCMCTFCLFVCVRAYACVCVCLQVSAREYPRNPRWAIPMPRWQPKTRAFWKGALKVPKMFGLPGQGAIAALFVDASRIPASPFRNDRLTSCPGQGSLGACNGTTCEASITPKLCFSSIWLLGSCSRSY